MAETIGERMINILTQIFVGPKVHLLVVYQLGITRDYYRILDVLCALVEVFARPHEVITGYHFYTVVILLWMGVQLLVSIRADCNLVASSHSFPCTTTFWNLRNFKNITFVCLTRLNLASEVMVENVYRYSMGVGSCIMY